MAWKDDPRFSKIPREVLADKKLTHADIRVYGGLTSEIRKQGVNIVSWHYHELAEACCVSLRQVSLSLPRLARCGHISRSIDEIAGRPTFWLKSEVFQPKEARLFSIPKSAKNNLA